MKVQFMVPINVQVCFEVGSCDYTVFVHGGSDENILIIAEKFDSWMSGNFAKFVRAYSKSGIRMIECGSVSHDREKKTIKLFSKCEKGMSPRHEQLTMHAISKAFPGHKVIRRVWPTK
jgi:hypothetical protein